MHIFGGVKNLKAQAEAFHSDNNRVAGDLRADEKRLLHTLGFLSVADFCTQSDVKELRGLIAKVLKDQNLGQKTTVRDLTGGDNLAVREVVSPSKLEPKLLQTQFFKRALAITEAMYGDEATLGFDHIVDKPKHNMKETAWHQDCAYTSALSLSSKRLHWWIPLCDVDENNGCMAYIAGSHNGPRLKHVPVAFGAHTLMTQDTSFADEATYCAVRAGGACVHFPRTLHFTGANHSNASRIAWIFQTVVRTKIPRWV